MKRDSKPKFGMAGARRPSWISLLAIGAIVASKSMMVGIVSAQAAGDDLRLLKDAQRVFKPLPKDAATAEQKQAEVMLLQVKALTLHSRYLMLVCVAPDVQENVEAARKRFESAKARFDKLVAPKKPRKQQGG